MLHPEGEYSKLSKVHKAQGGSVRTCLAECIGERATESGWKSCGGSDESDSREAHKGEEVKTLLGS